MLVLVLPVVFIAFILLWKSTKYKCIYLILSISVMCVCCVLMQKQIIYARFNIYIIQNKEIHKSENNQIA